VAGLVSGTQTFPVLFPAGALVWSTFSYTFNPAMPASAPSTAIVVTLPAGGAGNTLAACNATGFQL
jgi:hypothetical protein